MAARSFAERWSEATPVLLDGPMGTELDRRGVGTELPLWSAWALLRQPAAVRAIHAEYVEAGAEIVTTNTFRTHRRSLAKGGFGARAAELTGLAVQLAREAAATAERPCWVAGSIAPLEDCYSPELTPPESDLVAEHAAMADGLVGAGVDLILVETMPTVREAVAATRAAIGTELPVLTGFTCDRLGRLVSGESVAEAVDAVEPLGVVGLLINCTPTESLLPALRAAVERASVPVGAYGNVGHVEETTGWITTDPLGPVGYLRYAEQWLEAGARLVGGCCGTTPAHTRALADRLRSR